MKIFRELSGMVHLENGLRNTPKVAFCSEFSCIAYTIHTACILLQVRAMLNICSPKHLFWGLKHFTMNHSKVS